MIKITICGDKGPCERCGGESTEAKVLAVECRFDSPHLRDRVALRLCVPCLTKKITRFIDDDITDQSIPF